MDHAVVVTASAATEKATAASAVSISSLETIRVMRRQEDSPAYRVVDYLSQIPSSAFLAVDADCRSAMMKWCYQVADACSYDRETVSIAMSCLDRFLGSSSTSSTTTTTTTTTMDGDHHHHYDSSPPSKKDSILYDRNRFQLAAMTALYMAIKVHERRPMDSRLMSSLSHYSHSPKDIEAMERDMLQTIGWRVNPPTAQSFVRSMVPLLPDYYHTMMDEAERETIVELTFLQLDVFSTTTTTTTTTTMTTTTSCYYDYTTPASWLAFASLLNAVESVVVSSNPNTSVFGVKVGFAHFETTMTNLLRIDRDSLRQIRVALYEAIHDGSSSIATASTSSSATTCGEGVVGDDDEDLDEDEDLVMMQLVDDNDDDDDAAMTITPSATEIMKHHHANIVAVDYGGTQERVHNSPRVVRA
eukprot:CAMPEP_0117069910 /NCGR_PEP_ID=MMETSP0472-20121206/49063_1 /TAXON_ID=693140 ORGANISM="Tiarina fusus, Strain LIS" /NCGR_SAMPLE_ID=MMETSP0472 /ASSEMBLY_ACC=CAM_ASM_000603 /LENGTH=414 /DNA_ID=CAMNT_0004792697 /DNA_START=90 /DNA_END=1334 /DNA_ORIENTATION=+